MLSKTLGNLLGLTYREGIAEASAGLEVRGPETRLLRSRFVLPVLKVKQGKPSSYVNRGCLKWLTGGRNSCCSQEPGISPKILCAFAVFRCPYTACFVANSTKGLW